MRRLKNFLLISLLVLSSVLIGCQSVPPKIEYKLPNLDAFRPPLAPQGLISEPQTTSDLMLNSVQWEYWGYAQQDYAFSLEDYIKELSVLFAPK